MNITPNLGINTFKMNEDITSEVNFMISITEKCKHIRVLRPSKLIGRRKISLILVSIKLLNP